MRREECASSAAPSVYANGIVGVRPDGDETAVAREASYTAPRSRVRSLLPLRRPTSRWVAAGGFTRLHEAGSPRSLHVAAVLEDLTMSIFGSLMGKILGNNANASAPKGNATATVTPPAPMTPIPSAPSTTAPPKVDVELVLETMAAGTSQKLDWRNSIVDLMKLVGIDSSLANRKALAQELGYTGDMNDSAAMNVWLHKEVMRRLAENGGHVPANLTD